MSMTTFDASAHPRGNPENSGQFRAKDMAESGSVHLPSPDQFAAVDRAALISGALEEADALAAARRILERKLSESDGDEGTGKVRQLAEEDDNLAGPIAELARSKVKPEADIGAFLVHRLLTQPTKAEEASWVVSEKNPEWDVLKRQMVMNGASEPQARALTAAKVAIAFTEQLRDASQDAIRGGHDAHALMTTTGFKAVAGAIRPIADAYEDPSAAATAIAGARREVSSMNNMFGSFHHTGSEPVLKGVSELLDDLGEYLKPLAIEKTA